MAKKGEKYGTNHAKNALQRRYKLDVPFEVFLDLIAAGEAIELLCAVQGRQIFDVHLRCPPITVRAVIGRNAAGDADPFIVTFLPTHRPDEQSKIKRLTGRDKQKYHAVFRNVRLRLEEAADESMDEQFDDNLFNQETGLWQTTLTNQTSLPDQTGNRITPKADATLGVRRAPNRFSTLAHPLAPLGLNNLRKLSSETATVSSLRHMNESKKP